MARLRMNSCEVLIPVVNPGVDPNKVSGSIMDSYNKSLNMSVYLVLITCADVHVRDNAEQMGGKDKI